MLALLNREESASATMMSGASDFAASPSVYETLPVAVKEGASLTAAIFTEAVAELESVTPSLTVNVTARERVEGLSCMFLYTTLRRAVW